mmetsp:Transcript_9445/g.12251  ORF Transcript_9445/g.12251 Transcript_9445/m.12251 type:complete len:200 (-) Transcript_9445:403-1002(-)
MVSRFSTDRDLSLLSAFFFSKSAVPSFFVLSVPSMSSTASPRGATALPFLLSPTMFALRRWSWVDLVPSDSSTKVRLPTSWFLLLRCKSSASSAIRSACACLSCTSSTYCSSMEPGGRTRIFLLAGSTRVPRICGHASSPCDADAASSSPLFAPPVVSLDSSSCFPTLTASRTARMWNSQAERTLSSNDSSSLHAWASL